MPIFADGYPQRRVKGDNGDHPRTPRLMNDSTLKIDRRFRGPPFSGNGGYACGILGMRLGAVATVRLHAPPPLDSALTLHADASALRLCDAERTIATARSATLDLHAPPAPSLEAAEAASEHYAGFASHPFPGCFVCGPDRAPGDGLRIFPAPVSGMDCVAAPWTPAANLADGDGRVRDEFVWSALDCTGFFAFGPLPDGAPALLGEMTARLDVTVRAGAPHIATGWMIGSEGRKRFVGSAVYTADGTPCAVARATWIVVPPGTAGAS